jgi:hypothetical protein
MSGMGYGSCEGEVLPAMEDCASAADESCDGAGCGDTLGTYVFGQGVYSVVGAVMDAADWGGQIVVGGSFVNPPDPGGLAGVGWVKLSPSLDPRPATPSTPASPSSAASPPS